MLTVSRSPVDFSELGGIWDGPSHSGNMYCGQMNWYFRYFLGGMDAVCSGPKKKRIIQTVTSNKSKSQDLSWYGVVSVPLAKVTGMWCILNTFCSGLPMFAQHTVMFPHDVSF